LYHYHPALVWADLRVHPSIHDHSAGLPWAFRPIRVNKANEIAAVVTNAKPAGVCFEYDEPAPEHLEPLQRLRIERPTLPAMMLTVKHSEELAIWALRMRVWDYVVLPISGNELAERVATLVSAASRETLMREAAGLRAAAIPTPGLVQKKAANAHEKLLPAISYVEENYSEKVALGVVARLCGLGRFQFSRFFKRVHGKTFREFLIVHRIRKATQLLGLPGASITDVAFAVGFNDLSHFAQMFRRHVGICPSEYLHEAQSAKRF
jgi:two-component system, response regulator YesN